MHDPEQTDAVNVETIERHISDAGFDLGYSQARKMCRLLARDASVLLQEVARLRDELEQVAEARKAVRVDEEGGAR